MNKYIFPGGEPLDLHVFLMRLESRMPTMSHMTQEFSDRWHMEDWHSFGKSYVMTLRCWLDRVKDWQAGHVKQLCAARQGLDELDPRFRRMLLGS